MISIFTDNPEKLLQQIYKDIDDKKTKTWSYDEDGDFTHDNTQWEGNAWLRPKTKVGILELGIISNDQTNVTVLDYAMYHGRFTELLLNKYDKLISKITISSLATCPPDILKATK